MFGDDVTINDGCYHLIYSTIYSSKTTARNQEKKRQQQTDGQAGNYDG